LITGFPGETEAEFNELVEFVEQQKFDHMGVFTYSFEADTPSGRLPDQLPEEVKEERRERLMAAQQPVAFERNQAQLGKQIDIILDQPVEGEQNVWIGRSKADAPDVDGVIYVSGGNTKLSAGDIVRCEIAASHGYDLAAAVVGKPK
jgi:ribosomal protein S12 methylthiotransferase